MRDNGYPTSHDSHALDIVVEGAVLVPVHLQQPERVVLAKVLKLDETVLAEPLDNRLIKIYLIGAKRPPRNIF